MEQRDVSYLFRRDALEHQSRVASIAGSVSSADTFSVRQWGLILLLLIGLIFALVPLFNYAATASMLVSSAHWSAEGELIVDLRRTSHRASATFSPGETVTLSATSANGRLSTLCVVTSAIDGALGAPEQLVLGVSQPVRRAIEAEGDPIHLDLRFKDPEATLGAALKRMLKGDHP